MAQAQQTEAPKKKAPVDPHADCPPVVWDGTGWICSNHYPPMTVNKPREKFVPLRRHLLVSEAVTAGKVEVNAQTSEKARLQKEVAQLTADNTMLRATVAELEAAGADNKMTRDALAEVAKLTNDVAELDQSAMGREAEITNLTTELAQAKAEPSDALAEVAKLTNDVAELDQITMGREAEITNLTTELAQAKAHIAATSGDIPTEDVPQPEGGEGMAGVVAAVHAKVTGKGKPKKK